MRRETFNPMLVVYERTKVALYSELNRLIDSGATPQRIQSERAEIEDKLALMRNILSNQNVCVSDNAYGV